METIRFFTRFVYINNLQQFARILNIKVMLLEEKTRMRNEKQESYQAQFHRPDSAERIDGARSRFTVQKDTTRDFFSLMIVEDFSLDN